MANLDWPSQPGLPVAQQQAELIAILNTAAKLNLNAIIFQVRPAADAFYASTNEPWSYYLTGTMGRPPAPDFRLRSARVRDHRGASPRPGVARVV